MNSMVLKDNEAFSKLTSDVIARQHLIAYGDGDGYFRIVKDRFSSSYGARVSTKELRKYVQKCKKVFQASELSL